MSDNSHNTGSTGSDSNGAEPDLSRMFRSVETPKLPELDTGSILRRTRRRRLPRKIGVGSVFSLAVAGLALGGVSAFRSVGSPTSASISSASDAGTDASAAPETTDLSGGATTYQSDSGATPGNQGASKRAPADRINLCGGAVAEVAPSESGLVLTTSFPDASVGAASVLGKVTLTNTGTKTVSGTTAATPAITLAQDGVVLWHSNGPMIQMAAEVNLAPGESMTYTASFSPVVCGVDDDLAESFRTDLPAAPAGDYQVSAAIDLTGAGNADLITGPSQTITLR